MHANQQERLYFCSLIIVHMGLLLITLLLLILAVGGIAIKLWAKKDGKFAGTCASQSPFLNKDGDNCSFCGKTPEQFGNCSEETHTK